MTFLFQVANLQTQSLPYLRSLSVSAGTDIEINTHTFRFKYKISNPNTNPGNFNRLELDISRPAEGVEFDTLGLLFSGRYVENTFRRDFARIGNAVIPVGFPGLPKFWIGEITDHKTVSISGQFIFPGSYVDGIVINSKGLPGIRSFVAEPQDITDLYPSPDQVTNRDSLAQRIDADRDAVKYRGFTIGPTAPPASFNSIAFLDTLISYTTQSRSLSWISSQSTADKYTSYFNSAKSYLQSNIGFVRAVLQKVLSDVNIDSSSTMSSEAYALLRFNTEYLLSQLPVPPVSTYSLFATHSLYLEQSSTVYSGDIGVNAAGSSPFLDSDVELSVGIGVTTAATYSVKANRINLKSNATANGNVYYNTLTSNGTITGSQNTPLSLPLTTTLPEFKTSTPGTQNISVATNGSQTLQPGSYNNVDVNGGGTLIFTGGVYHFNSWNSGDNAQVKFQGPTEVRIAQKFDGGSGSYIGPQDTTTLSADQIMFYVAGINGTNGSLTTTPKAAKIGIGSTVRACFYAPNGTLWIRQSSDARGQFIGKDVDVGIGVNIRR